jgi:hypothetical protein
LFAAGKEKWPNTGYNPAGIIIIRDYITVMLTGGYIHPVVVTDTFMRKQLKYHPVAIIAYNACRCEAACIPPSLLQLLNTTTRAAALPVFAGGNPLPVVFHP